MMVGQERDASDALHDFRSGTSDVDWCEHNYEVTKLVAEFYNTISNALFFIMPPLLIYLNWQYAKRVSIYTNLIWALLVIVGIGSVYFHATLSLVGQLLDEISIVWVIFGAIALLFPREHMPTIFRGSRDNFRKVILCTALVASFLAFLMPVLNAFILFSLGFPCAYILVKELKRCKCPRVYYLGCRCCLTWVVAVICWLSDKFFCRMWSSIAFPYLHCFWHIFIAISGCTSIVTLIYFNAVAEVPEQMPVLKYWPSNKWDNFGIPYIAFKALAPCRSTCKYL
ncbi:alkaline ceramidase 2-like [Lineus longissimus]|uniref:alkaline ceramidase 2-like n=1 Tax=Lineus longissimus TaxID=88925 RepID=UPI002B4D11DE